MIIWRQLGNLIVGGLCAWHNPNSSTHVFFDSVDRVRWPPMTLLYSAPIYLIILLDNFELLLLANSVLTLVATAA